MITRIDARGHCWLSPLALAGAVALCATGAFGQAPAGTTQATGTKPQSVTLGSTTYDWGVAFPLVRIGAVRDPTQPARTRSYEADLRFIAPEVTLQLMIRPAMAPFQRPNSGTGQAFNVMSLTLFTSLGINYEQSARSEVSVGFGMSFLEDIIVLGLGVDLYRGIAVRGGDGMAGSHTIPTGLLGALFTSEGEVTVENFYFAIHINLAGLRNVGSR